MSRAGSPLQLLEKIWRAREVASPSVIPIRTCDRSPYSLHDSASSITHCGTVGETFASRDLLGAAGKQEEVFEAVENRSPSQKASFWTA
jgi:hypothetical protein